METSFQYLYSECPEALWGTKKHENLFSYMKLISLIFCLLLATSIFWTVIYTDNNSRFSYKAGITKYSHPNLKSEYFLLRLFFDWQNWDWSNHLSEEFKLPHSWPGPIDVVYTWVNGSEPRQRAG